MLCRVSNLASKAGRRVSLALAAGGLFVLSGTPAGASTVTLELFFEDGTLASGSVAILVADVNGDGFLPFTDPSTLGTVLAKGETVGGSDDVILAVVQADDGGHWNGSAGLADTVESLDYAEIGISPDVPLILYLFPDITVPGTAVTLGEDVVTYRKSDKGNSGGDIGFETPNDPGVYTLSALTSAQGGSFDPQNPVTGETSNRADSGVPGSAVGSDDHGNTPGRATPLTPGGQGIPGYLSSGDSDYFSISLSGPSRVIAYTTGNTDTVGLLFGPGSVFAGSDDNSGSNLNFRIDEVISGPGTVNVAVQGKGGTELGAYEVFVEVIPLAISPSPDVSIGKSLTSQRGIGIYNRSGASQKLKQVSKNRKKLKFYFKVKNDNEFADTISVTATPKDKTFKASYLRLSGARANLTGDLKRGDYITTLAGGAEETFQLTVKPTRSAKRAKKAFTFDAESSRKFMDRVKAEVKAK